MPEPQGLGKSAIYLSTEDDLNTARLAQMLETHPAYKHIAASDLPSFDRILSMTVTDLEKQQQIVEYQLPNAIDKYNVGLIVMDSVAANFRADRETATTGGLLDRAADLNKLGTMLRRLAVQKKIAVVVTNQVSDRFAENVFPATQEAIRSSPSSSATPSQHALQRSQRETKLSLDYQQRFFTGWGDQLRHSDQDLKTPALGLTWANQVDARIVLKIESSTSRAGAGASKRRRFLNVVFAPWCSSSVQPLEYAIEAQGLEALSTQQNLVTHDELLDEQLWAADDEEFP
jgi:DNA repair protein RAD57